MSFAYYLGARASRPPENKETTGVSIPSRLLKKAGDRLDSLSYGAAIC